MNNPLKGRENTIVGNALKNVTKKFLMMTERIKPQILFESFNGAQYSDNPRAISEMMHKLYSEYKIVWYLKKDANKILVPDYVECISDRIGFYKALFSSFCYVNNCEFQELVGYKKKGQLYVQTWHGDRYFKKILYEADPDWGSKSHMCDSEVVDIALAGSVFAYNSYKTAFRYSGRIEKYGCPRNERMLQMTEKDKKAIKEYLGIEDGTSVLLYAPTFRDNDMNIQNIFIDIESTLRTVEKKYDGKWIGLARGHVGKKLTGLSISNNIIDATSYPDMADLLAITDFLITDYSSTAMDFYLTGKPVVLATYDLNEYEENCREFKINPLESGLLCARNQAELESIIIALDETQLNESYRAADKVFETTETGDSTKRICHEINTFFEKTKFL